MEPTQSPSERSPLPQITTWQESSIQHFETAHDGMIARLLRGCFAIYDAINQELPQSKSITKRSTNIIRRSHATLKLWADGHRVADGALDELLEESRSLQHATLGTLNSLCSILCNRLSKHIWLDEAVRVSVIRDTNAQTLYEQTRWITHDTARDGASESDSSSDECQGSEIEEVLQDVKLYTQCLVDLNAALECPAMDPAHEEKDTRIGDLESRNAFDYYSDLIFAKFPEASVDLVHCLGKINWARYQRMQLERESNARAAAEPMIKAEQTTFSKSHYSHSEFRDSGLGTSIPAQHSIYGETDELHPDQAVHDTSRSNYAETILSFMTGLSEGNHLKIPPMPAEGKDGQEFECLACGRNVRFNNNRAWRKHLFNDLQPYSCFFSDCNFSDVPFENRRTWSNHLELDHKFGPHWESITCPLCQETTGPGKSTILIHFARHMEDCSLSALPRGIDSEANSEIESESSSDNLSQISTQQDIFDKNSARLPRKNDQACSWCGPILAMATGKWCSELCQDSEADHFRKQNQFKQSLSKALGPIGPFQWIVDKYSTNESVDNVDYNFQATRKTFALQRYEEYWSKLAVYDRGAKFLCKGEDCNKQTLFSFHSMDQHLAEHCFRIETDLWRNAISKKAYDIATRRGCLEIQTEYVGQGAQSIKMGWSVVEHTSERLPTTDTIAQIAGRKMFCSSSRCGQLVFSTVDELKSHNAAEHVGELSSSEEPIVLNPLELVRASTGTKVRPSQDQLENESERSISFNDRHSQKCGSFDDLISLKSYESMGQSAEYPLPGSIEHDATRLVSNRGDRKKRISAACFDCRGRKIKCDRKRPECDNCIRSKITCKGYMSKLHWRPTDELPQHIQASIASPNSVPDHAVLAGSVNKSDDVPTSPKKRHVPTEAPWFPIQPQIPPTSPFDFGSTESTLLGLPSGWAARWDYFSKRHYYVETETGKIQWDLPRQPKRVSSTAVPEKQQRPSQTVSSFPPPYESFVSVERNDSTHLPGLATSPPQTLSEHAMDEIQKKIINPMVAQVALKDFRLMLETIPYRIQTNAICSLRSLESTLMFLAQECSPTPALYLRFCEESIRLLRTTIVNLPMQDQCLPTERPYTNEYFTELLAACRRQTSEMVESQKHKTFSEIIDEWDDPLTDGRSRVLGQDDGYSAEKPSKKNPELGNLFPLTGNNTETITPPDGHHRFDSGSSSYISGSVVQEYPSSRLPRVQNPMRTRESTNDVSFACPIFQYESLHALAHTCNGVHARHMADVCRHLTAGCNKHVEFLRCCPVCNEYVLIKEDFEDSHGYRGEHCSVLPKRMRGSMASERKWRRLYAQLYPMEPSIPSPFNEK